MKELIDSIFEAVSPHKPGPTLKAAVTLEYFTTDGGRTKVLARFYKVLDVPVAVIGRNVTFALYIGDVRHLFPAQVAVWDEKAGVIINCAWPYPDDRVFLEQVRADQSWTEALVRE